MKKALGVCIGAATISFVVIEETSTGKEVVSHEAVIHGGNPKQVLYDYFTRNDLSDHSVVVTGRKFRSLLNTLSVPEPEAVEAALKYLDLSGKYDAVASLGSENFLVYYLNQKGEIINVVTGNKCASGTGEFFLQQIRRMDLDVKHSVSLAKEQKPYAVSGRCSVFCKSDCTHALNKGIPKGEVVAGLCQMIAGKIVELLAKEKFNNVLAIGGVCQNDSVIRFLEEKYPAVYIPNQAAYFEALGAALIGLEKESHLSSDNLFRGEASHFSFLQSLKEAQSSVTFKTMDKGIVKEGDVCIVGLDVGSTTTKAVILRVEDDAILASVYLRTNGAPIEASLNCYRELREQIDTKIKLIGLGVTGSGRHIAGLHALTKGDINEIIAHATAAAYFDKEVDTIFEIGGQDAKYTFLTNGVASDYAMNEACSAGTGSFLEESAKETLNIDYRDIADMAMKGNKPPNFNDQCAAFIQSDIKTAMQEGISKEDVVAGLVYSICMNYNNRVKGSRPVGKKIFMQGGVCNNYAVPIAMSILVHKDIIVPPEPGLMGAYGVALEIKKRLRLGLMEEQAFDLEELIGREIKYGKEFICPGGEDKCDRKCEIAVIEVNGQKYAFGGACSRYYNQRLKINVKPGTNYVKIRQELVFKKYAALPPGEGKSVGIMKTFMTDTLYPLFYNFFTKLGFRVILSEKVEKEGIDKVESSFCYPVEISHGFFQDLLNKKPDYIFLPHIVEMNDPKENNYKRPCVFAQAESYFLRAAFKGQALPEIIDPVINFAKGGKHVDRAFAAIGKRLGKSGRGAVKAYQFARTVTDEMLKEFRGLGKEALAELEKDPERIGMVVFGRPYNAFVEEANMAIPHKFTSRGIMVLPQDFLPSEGEESQENMYWYSGQQISRGARFLQKHPQLFGTYITNFSCGPDSFLLSYFRKIMGERPSLTLELDSHTADVGIDTRIDAALDIIRNYSQLKKSQKAAAGSKASPSLQVSRNKLRSADIEVVLPSMGRFSTQALSAIFRSLGIRAKALPVPTMATLKLGRSATTGKECLPLILTAGSMLEYLKERKDTGKKTLFFMPTGGGPCRQGQYVTRLQDIIEERQIGNIGILTLDDEKAYDQFGLRFLVNAWISAIISDAMQEMENAILALALDRERGLQSLEAEWEKIGRVIGTGSPPKILAQLRRSMVELSRIKLSMPLRQAKKISLTGEVFVRREEFSRIDLIKQLADKGFVVVPAPVSEYIYYCNYLIANNSIGLKTTFMQRWKTGLSNRIQLMIEKKVRAILAGSGLAMNRLVEVDRTIRQAEHLISDSLLGEGVLTVGSALREIMDEACGVISIGPFACMPSRLAESILKKEMTVAGKQLSDGNIKDKKYPAGVSTLPYLHIETDGNVYPQIIQSKIEIFMLQAERFHRRLADMRLGNAHDRDRQNG